MRYIGIDYGTKKVGIALSDESGTMAFPHTVIKNDETLFQNIVTFVREHRGEVVLGDSRALNGTANPITEEIQSFGERLKNEGVVVTYEPEFFTSKEAERIQGRTALQDASAAALILNSFLVKKKNTAV